MDAWEHKYWGLYYELRDLKQSKEWISVDDRLPDDQIKCLIYRNGCHTAEYYRDGAFYNFMMERYSPDPTHWMSLPKEPVTEREAKNLG